MALWRALLPLVIYVCRPALGQSVVVVEVGAESVTLFCKSPSGNLPSVVWTRGSDEVHKSFNQKDDFRDQSPLFRGRTQMKTDALELKNPTLTDSGTYTCVTSEGGQNVTRITVNLRVKGHRVSVTEGSSVTLPFPMRALGSEVWVRWTYGSEEVLLLKDGREDLSAQSQRFKGRTWMKSDALQSGDLGLVLTNSTPSDDGLYTCEVTNSSSSSSGLELARTSVDLIVSEPPPGPARWIIAGIFLFIIIIIIVPHGILFFLIYKRKNQHKESWRQATINLIFCKPTQTIDSVKTKCSECDKETTGSFIHKSTEMFDSVKTKCSECDKETSGSFIHKSTEMFDSVKTKCSECDKETSGSPKSSLMFDSVKTKCSGCNKETCGSLTHKSTAMVNSVEIKCSGCETVTSGSLIYASNCLLDSVDVKCSGCGTVTSSTLISTARFMFKCVERDSLEGETETSDPLIPKTSLRVYPVDKWCSGCEKVTSGTLIPTSSLRFNSVEIKCSGCDTVTSCSLIPKSSMSCNPVKTWCSACHKVTRGSLIHLLTSPDNYVVIKCSKCGTETSGPLKL